MVLCGPGEAGKGAERTLRTEKPGLQLERVVKFSFSVNPFPISPWPQSSVKPVALIGALCVSVVSVCVHLFMRTCFCTRIPVHMCSCTHVHVPMCARVHCARLSRFMCVHMCFYVKLMEWAVFSIRAIVTPQARDSTAGVPGGCCPGIIRIHGEALTPLQPT